MRYCRRCLYPDTKPYLTFDSEGICNGCRSAERKQAAEGAVDWAERGRAFYQLVEAARAAKAPLYDVAVPVSGGKDSITQVSRLLGRDLRILAINIDYGIKTEIGDYNLERIPLMGASLTIFTPEAELHRRLVRIGIEDFGDHDLMSHCLLHAMPLRIAHALSIPLVVMGENAAEVYGGDLEVANESAASRAWFTKYAANAGRDARFIADRYGIPFERLLPYDFPDEIVGSRTKAVFMSSYFRWDSEEHFEIAQRYGFTPLDQPAEGTYRNYVGIDEKLHRLHQFIKVLKFGYGRATDHACEDIRAGRLDREAAKDLIRQHDLLSLSDDVADAFCRFVGMDRDEFHQRLETFRNQAIWTRGNDGRWIIPGHLEG